jgi:DnaK suppressor protein
MTKDKNRKSNGFKFPQDVLEPVKDFLTSELNKLKKRRDVVEEEDPFANEDRVNDNAALDIEVDEQFGHARARAVSDQINKRIIQIKKALARIKIGRYGICEECDQFINTKRLMVHPETTLCVKCREKHKDK